MWRGRYWTRVCRWTVPRVRWSTSSRPPCSCCVRLCAATHASHSIWPGMSHAMFLFPSFLFFSVPLSDSVSVMQQGTAASGCLTHRHVCRAAHARDVPPASGGGQRVRVAGMRPGTRQRLAATRRCAHTADCGRPGSGQGRAGRDSRSVRASLFDRLSISR
jgi:hypothetical protein